MRGRVFLRESRVISHSLPDNVHGFLINFVDLCYSAIRSPHSCSGLTYLSCSVCILPLVSIFTLLLFFISFPFFYLIISFGKKSRLPSFNVSLHVLGSKVYALCDHISCSPFRRNIGLLFNQGDLSSIFLLGSWQRIMISLGSWYGQELSS